MDMVTVLPLDDKKDDSVMKRKLCSILEMYYLKQAKEARLDLSIDSRPSSTAENCSDFLS